MKYEEGEIILCKVTEIAKTTVFVETLDGIKGSIVLSEIAPGRIRNLREYVVPKKVIVCKILQIKDNHLFLSLRRVKHDERKNLMEEFKKENSHKSMLKKILGNDFDETINNIVKETSLVELFEEARNDEKVLDKYFNKKQKEEIVKIIAEKPVKDKEIKRQFKLTCKQPDGILRIKKLLSIDKDISYLGSSNFLVKKTSKDIKKASQEMQIILDTLEKQAKKEKCIFELKKWKSNTVKNANHTH